ncbi:eukaryotic translation initiation factor 2D [Culicoides brevitarsis]|uniref:eukaryotic translation initiation factor 2D n=1 Tax=Culicoides brevitarsis TaxID=469753 RepID=UPI00307CC552
MFIKPFKPRGNIQLKGSDKKRLKSRVLSAFPNLKDEEFSNVLSNKATVSSVKAVTHNEENILIYTIDKQPFFFEIVSSGKLLPTVYALWKFPDMIPCFSTHSDVLPKLANGADLMIPGVVKSGGDLKSWGSYKKDDIFGINLTSNKAVIAVGLLAHSSQDLYMCGGRGVAVHVLHVFGDKLWGMEPSMCEQPPMMKPVMAVPTNDDFPPLGAEPPSVKEVTQQVSKLEVSDDVEKVTEKEEEPVEATPDEILYRAFLNCIKLEGKKIQLPMLTSTFYPQHIQPALESPIDIKKTTYKKVSAFLREMEKQNFIKIQEEAKGIEKISFLNLEHPAVLDFIPNKQEKQAAQSTENAPQLLLTKMTQVYVVTENTANFFSNFNLPVGSKLDEKQIKDHVKDYAGRKKLLDKTIQKVNLDEVLSEICLTEGPLSVDDIAKMIKNSMNASFEMRTQDKAPVKGGKKPVIHITTATRTGNKKVTIISNLDLYGVNITEFAKAIKLAVAASTSMTEVPGYKSEQLLVQGNHVSFVYNLLVDTYKIPRGNITGLEFAKKEKKKKK